MCGDAAAGRPLHPQPLPPLGTGMALSAVAATVNFGIAQLLLRVGRVHRLLAAEGDSRHLLADAWITGGVIPGGALAAFSGRERIGPVMAALVALA